MVTSKRLMISPGGIMGDTTEVVAKNQGFTSIESELQTLKPVPVVRVKLFRGIYKGIMS